MKLSISLKNVHGIVDIDQLDINVEYSADEFASIMSTYVTLLPHVLDMIKGNIAETETIIGRPGESLEELLQRAGLTD